MIDNGLLYQLSADFLRIGPLYSYEDFISAAAGARRTSRFCLGIAAGDLGLTVGTETLNLWAEAARTAANPWLGIAFWVVSRGGLYDALRGGLEPLFIEEDLLGIGVFTRKEVEAFCRQQALHYWIGNVMSLGFEVP